MIIITLFAVWATAFLKLNSHTPLYFDIDPMPLFGILSIIVGNTPLTGVIFTFLLLSLIAFLLVNLNTSLFFINERTFLPAVIYILLTGLFPQHQVLNPVLPAAVFLMLAIRRIMDAYRIMGLAYNFFDAGILISMGSLFYANLIWFGILVIIGVALLRTGDIKELSISFMGLIIPYLLTFGVYYVLGKDLNTLLSLINYNLFGKTILFSFSRLTIVVLIFTGVLTLLSLFYLFTVINSKKIKSRKTFYLFLWTFVISISIFLVLPTVSVEIVWITGIPVSYFLTHYFVFVRKRQISEIFFYLLIFLIALIQIMYLI
jgi:hypothetical protein